MRKIGIAAALTAAFLVNAVSTKPAKAETATAAVTIGAAVVAGIVTILTLKCTNETKVEYLCIYGPPPGFVGKTQSISGTMLLSQNQQFLKHPMQAYLNENTLKLAQSLHPEMKLAKPRKKTVLASLQPPAKP